MHNYRWLGVSCFISIACIHQNVEDSSKAATLDTVKKDAANLLKASGSDRANYNVYFVLKVLCCFP